MVKLLSNIEKYALLPESASYIIALRISSIWENKLNPSLGKAEIGPCHLQEG